MAKPGTFDFLPVTIKEAHKRGWGQLDVILFSGDAYVDHPSFGIAIMGRLLENLGLKVAIVPQPNWKDDLRDFKKFGEPKLFFGVSAGVMDSMVNHYTANKRLRSDDAYTPGNKAGFRPDYPTIVYTKILKGLFPNAPVVIGGIEASMRRFTHYDYWQDQLKPSILLASGADMLVYGMAEKPVKEVVRLLEKGVPFTGLNNIPQTAVVLNSSNEIPKKLLDRSIYLHSHEECLKSKKAFAENFVKIEKESNKLDASPIIQQVEGQYILVNPPSALPTEQEADSIYDLPFARLPHPKYDKKGIIKAYEMIKNSINIHRGCFGGCSFCTISMHQGKFINSRSEASIVKEVETLTGMPGFKGVLTDLGGPSANMYKMKGKDQYICAKCLRPSCIFPQVCKNLDTSHNHLNSLYKKVASIKTVKKIFIGSGIRYDLLLSSYNPQAGKPENEYMHRVITQHVSGKLKVAPEHTSKKVLNEMRKPSFEYYREFNRHFKKISKNSGLKQQLVPYFISSHPGCTEEDMAELAAETKSLGIKPDQVQDFTPTPMTLATVMYYTGLNPYTMKTVKVAKTKNEKQTQNLYFFWYKPGMFNKIKKRLTRIKRPDLLKRLS